MSPDQKLMRARRARLDGDYRAAELMCREILDRNPVHPEATGLLGQILAEHGDVAAAKSYIDLALGLAPKSAAVQLNAASLYEREGDLKGALDALKRATDLDPRLFEAWATYGNLLGRAALFEQAAKALTNACRLNPHHPGAALLLAGARLEIGDAKGAAEALDFAEAASPRLPQTAKLRTAAARLSGDDAALEKAAARWLELDPKEDDARLALGYALAQQGYYARAVEALRLLGEKDAPNPDHLVAIGRYCLGARSLEGGRRWFEKALAINPDTEEAHFGLARAALFAGDLEAAESHCRRTLALGPGHIDALAQIAEIRNGEVDDEIFGRLKALSVNASVRPDARATAGYALGDIHHRRRDPDAAFGAWSAANDLKRAIHAKRPRGLYDPAAQERRTDRLMALFPEDPSDGRRRTEKSEPSTPIFIVGMPRSGTTLLENALAAHPDAAGAGEVPALPFLLSELLTALANTRGPAKISPEFIAAARGTYFRQSAEFAGRAGAYVVDKQPTNFESVGLIRVLFPDAPIIHIRRNPMDTGLSIFRRNFTWQWPFAFDLASIGHFYGQYARLMAHWERGYAGAVAFVQYEDLVDNFEGELRRLLDFCGLPWSEKCLDYQDAERAVHTFSAVQVRKGASKSHRGSAGPYESHLQPLADALLSAGVDPVTGALRPN